MNAPWCRTPAAAFTDIQRSSGFRQRAVGKLSAQHMHTASVAPLEQRQEDVSGPFSVTINTQTLAVFVEVHLV
jgi:hypothetical protein